MMNKKAVITGATRGIGKAIAKSLAEAGYDLALLSRSASDLEALTSEIHQHFSEVEIITFAGDLSKPEEAKAFALFIEKQWKSVDVLINNAGIYIEGGIINEEENVLEQMMNLHFYSAYHLSKHLCQGMREVQSGHIINICSVASKEVVKGASYYSISKQALYAFSNALREEVRKDHIKVTSILPGSTYTSSWDNIDLQAEMIQAEDIAKTVLYALSLSFAACAEEILIKPILFRS